MNHILDSRLRAGDGSVMLIGEESLAGEMRGRHGNETRVP